MWYISRTDLLRTYNHNVLGCLVVYHHNMKEFFDSLKYVNENNCICHTLRYVSVPLILGTIKGKSQCKNVRFWNVNEIYVYLGVQCYDIAHDFW